MEKINLKKLKLVFGGDKIPLFNYMYDDDYNGHYIVFNPKLLYLVRDEEKRKILELHNGIFYFETEEQSRSAISLYSSYFGDWN